MKSHKQIAHLTLALLTTVDELGTAPSGPAYASAMSAGFSLAEYNAALGALQGRGLVTVSPAHEITITDAGRNAAAKANALLAAARP